MVEMKNLTENDIQHLIEMHEEAIAKLKLEISPRPEEPSHGIEGFPPVIGFHRLMPGMTSDDPSVETPFVAIRYSNGCWFINRGAGATSQALSWDGLLDWIGANHWHTIQDLIPEIAVSERADQPKSRFGCSNDGHHANCKCGT